MKQKKIFLNTEFDQIWSKIEAGENISVLRFADGERAIMMGQSILGADGWTSPNYLSKLGKDLIAALEINDPKAYYAISCPCCDQPAYYWFKTRISNPKITFSNLWVNANYSKFAELFKKLTREAVVVANHRAEGKPIGNLKILKYYGVSDDCFAFWENHADELLSSIKKDFGDKKNLLFVISAGPMSEPIIAELFRHNPDNCYIDFGSSIDRYYKSTQTRRYEDPKSREAKKVCWMHDPRTSRFDVSVVLTLYQRPEKLAEQLAAIEKQTLKPREVMIFHDASNLPLNLPDEEKLKSRLTNYIKVDKNVGVWGRFAAGLLATSKYVCFFDDDTIPGNRWLENCHTQMLKRKGLYGAIGIDSWNLRNYPYGSYVRWGWARPTEWARKVQFVGHSWFLEKDWLGAMWIDASRFYAFKYAAEDAFLSYSLKKWLNINTYVPPHPKDEMELYGSIPDKALDYGHAEDIAISLHPQSLERMNQALRLLADMGMRSRVLRVPTRVIHFYNYVESKIAPVVPIRLKKIVKRIVRIYNKILQSRL